MLKIILNSNFFLAKLFRKSFLKAVYSQISSNKHNFCCHCETWHKKFIDWSELKEVQENKSSKFVSRTTSDYDKWTCWFDDKEDRLEFLKECLNKLK